MPYLPPCQFNKSMVAFFLRAISSLRFKSEAVFEQQRQCSHTDEPHKLCVRKEASNPVRFGEQYFVCRNEMCTGVQLPPPQHLEADKRDLIVRLHSYFRKYSLTKGHHRTTIEVENVTYSSDHDPNSCLMYWLSYILYIHRQSEFREAYDNAEDQLARYFQHRNGVAISTADWRIIKAAVTFTLLPEFKAHCSGNDRAQSDLSDRELPPRIKRRSVNDPASNKLSPAKKQWLEIISKGNSSNFTRITETLFDAGTDFIDEKTVTEAEEEEETKDAEESIVFNQFLDAIPQLLSLILKNEVHSSVETECPCGSGQQRHYACRNCVQYANSCEECWIQRHEGNPFHWVHQWQPDGFYRRLNMACLREGTHALQLGHPGGICPSPDDPQNVTIVHTNGIHGTQLRMCFCNGRPDLVAQSMNARLFPGTLQAPRTFFTFQVLDKYLNHHLASEKSTYAYLGGLRQLTDGAFTSAVQDPYKQFRRATLIWRRLCADKWSGKAHDLGHFFPHRKPDNIIVFCLCCPEDGINTEDRWERTPKDLRHLVQQQFTADGNFHLNRYKKSTKDEKGDDISLLSDCVTGFFPSKESMQKHLAVAPPKNTEKSTCNYLKVVNNQDKKKYKNMAVTGIVGVQCSHVFMLSAVDLTAGEGFTYTDKAFAHAISHTRRDCNNSHFSSCDGCLAYDCNCQYCVNMRSRFEKTCPEILHIVRCLRFTIGPMHLPDHKDECMFLFSAAYMICMGEFNGDSGEQVWAMSNRLGPFTRQMNEGHRHDVISTWFLYWNWLKVTGIAQQLSIDIVDAQENLKVCRATFVSLSVQYSADITGWKAMEEECEKGKDNSGQQPLLSLYRHNVASIPSRTAIYRQILAKEDKTASKPTSRLTMATFLLEALHVQHAQQHILGKLTLNQTETVKRDIEERRERLKARVKIWRKLQSELMPKVEGDVLKQGACDTEKEVLFLPSDYNEVQRKEKDLESLAELEKTLREGELYDAIEEVCQSSKNQSIIRDQKDKNDWLLCCIDDYNHARRSLHALGSGLDLPEMKEEDTYQKSTVHKRGLGDSWRTDGQLYTMNLLSSPGMEEQVRTEDQGDARLGSGTQFHRRKGKKRGSRKKADFKDGWIWQPTVLFTRIDLSSKGQQEYERETDRVQWFHARAERDRWQEHLEKLEADFRNCIRHFAKMKTVWDVAAVSAESFGHQAYARRQGRMFKRFQTDAETMFMNLSLELKLPLGQILADRVARDRRQA
ncbi:hypothetical protein PQX77_006367 [Marasmius sp. AFHP31]|nr:hypothetical protein PQX77_006367 [Marasmius sp. AFHP31]